MKQKTKLKPSRVHFTLHYRARARARAQALKSVILQHVAAVVAVAFAFELLFGARRERGASKAKRGRVVTETCRQRRATTWPTSSQAMKATAREWERERESAHTCEDATVATVGLLTSWWVEFAIEQQELPMSVEYSQSQRVESESEYTHAHTHTHAQQAQTHYASFGSTAGKYFIIHRIAISGECLASSCSGAAG